MPARRSAYTSSPGSSTDAWVGPNRALTKRSAPRLLDMVIDGLYRQAAICVIIALRWSTRTGRWARIRQISSISRSMMLS